MKSIKWKLVAMYLVIVLIVMIVSGTFILLRLQSSEINKGRSELEQYAQKLEDQVVLSYDEMNFQAVLNDFYYGDSLGTSLQASILDSVGNTIATTTALTTSEYTYKNAVVISALAGNEAFNEALTEKTAEGYTKSLMGYAMPVMVNSEVKYVIYTCMDATAMNENISRTRQTIFISAVLAMLLTIVMGYIFSKTITEPILLLSKKAKDVAEGNFRQRIPVYSGDEIGKLSASFNYMASELNKNIGEISSEKNKMEIILDNMTDGVIAFNADGDPILSNMEALEMLGKDRMNLNFNNFVKEYHIPSKTILSLNQNYSAQDIFVVGDRFINAHFSVYHNENNGVEGIVAVLRDITEQKKLDDMRKEFVANVSHELRTPLTTVKSYTETLLDGAVDDKEVAVDFLNIIDSEADRMSFLVKDLLQLSRFDNKQIELKYRGVNVMDFISQCIKQNKIHADNKNQNLYCLPCDDDLTIKADRDRINQVLNNLITNAVKYSQEGATIKVFVTEDKDFVDIHVQDNGIGIKKEDLDRIFERFYRVDKTRSRAMGGTGLGLAIAKEIMNFHKGELLAQSVYGQGTTMTMRFSKNADFSMEE